MGCSRDALADLVRGADRVVILVLDEEGEPKNTIADTDAQIVRTVTEALGVCGTVEAAGLCGPPTVQIRLFQQDRLLVSASPTPCCGQFVVNGILYEDSSRKVRSAVGKAIKAKRPEAGD